MATTSCPILFGPLLGQVGVVAIGEVHDLSGELTVEAAEELIVSLTLAVARAKAWKSAILVEDLLG